MARGVSISEAMARKMGIDVPRTGAKTLRGRISRTPIERSPVDTADTPESATSLSSCTRRGSAKHGRLRLPDRSDFSVSLDLPIEPRTKARHRHVMPYNQLLSAFRASLVNGRHNEGRFMALIKKVHIHSYTEDETANFENTVRTMATLAMRGLQPCQTPVEAIVQFRLTGDYLDLPTDTTDPDIDNMTKAVFDGLNRTVYRDDRLVCWKTIMKVCDPTPSIRILIRAVSVSEPLRTGHYDLPLPYGAPSSIL